MTREGGTEGSYYTPHPQHTRTDNMGGAGIKSIAPQAQQARIDTEVDVRWSVHKLRFHPTLHHQPARSVPQGGDATRPQQGGEATRPQHGNSMDRSLE